MSLARIVGAAIVLSLIVVGGDRVHTQQPASSQPFQFHLLEATIADVHRGIQEGQLTCRALVQAYINRARAYNGTCNQLVTEAMAPKFLPDYAEYAAAAAATAALPSGDPRKTPPVEFGRMEPTASDPAVQQQFGMTVGIPNAGQVRALGMINIRGSDPSPAKAISIGIRRPARCRRARQPYVSSSAGSRMHWSALPNWTSSTVEIPISRRSPCTASPSPSRIPMK